MAENPSPMSRTLTLLALPILFLVGWYCLDVIEERREQAIRIEHLDSLRNRLPLMRERLTPQSLAHEKMFAGLHRLNGLNAKTARVIASRWDKAFGADIKYAIWNKDSSLLISHGLSGRDLDALMSIATERKCREFRERPPEFVFQNYLKGCMHLFGEVPSFLERNPISLKTRKVLGNSGQLMLGPWFPDVVFDADALIDLAAASATVSVPRASFAGTIALFVPGRIIRSSRWLVKALDLPTTALGIPRIHLVSKRRLLAGTTGIPGLTPGLARTAVFEAEALSEGALLDERMRGVAFVKKPGWPDMIALHVTDMPRPFRLARSPAMPGVLALLIAAMTLSLRFEASGSLAPGLLKQCMLICAVISCIPVCGLVWTGLIGNQSRFDSRRADAMQVLERRLEQIEAGHTSYMSTLIKPLRMFLESPAWRRGMLSADQLAVALPELRKSFLGTLYVFETSGKAHHFPTGIFSETDKQKQQVRILITSLLQYVQSTILIDGSSTAGDERQTFQRELKGGMVYDTISLAIGPENIYQLAITFDRLMPFQLFYETTLVMFHQVLDEALRPSMLLFAVLNRKLLVQREIVEIVNAHVRSAGTIPPVVLMQSDEHEAPPIYPIARGMEPALRLLLKRIQTEGGNIQTTISVKGIPCHVLARPLPGTDMVGAAVEPVDRSSGASVLPTLLAAAYPLMIVALALMLFQSFFLKPVGEMRKAVEAIAAGDYERRLPVLTDDEIGSLCLSFNTMAKDLAEKEFLRRFISDLTMQAVAGRHRRTATRLTATVMFTDIRGFTTMSETQPPEKITAMLNEYLTRMESVIEAHGGTIDKFIGDAIMSVFLPTHGMAPAPERAIRAAFGMRRELDAFNAARHAAGEFQIATGSGIATGEILMGVLGRSDGRQDFTVTGPTVNISSAMEKRSKEARQTPIVACPVTVESASAAVTAEPLPAAPGKPAGFELAALADSEPPARAP